MNRRGVSAANLRANANAPRTDDTARSDRKPERRLHRRYLVNVEIKYRLKEAQESIKTGIGRTINISTYGILFESQLPVPLGSRIEIDLPWPTRPQAQPLELRAEGYTIRAARNQTAMYIEQYAFRFRQER